MFVQNVMKNQAIVVEIFPSVDLPQLVGQFTGFLHAFYNTYMMSQEY